MTTLSQIVQYIKQPVSEADLSQVQRFFHGRGHLYPGLYHVTIDWFPPVILITLFEKEPINEVEKLTEQLLPFFPDCQSVQLQHRYLQSGPVEVIKGKHIDTLIVTEDKFKFNISLGASRNTGLFLDMRRGRQWVFNNSKNKRVLNLFAYTCGFSIAAIAGGARFVSNVDMSSPALNVGRQNHRLNHHELEKVSFEKLNIFKSFGRLKRRGPFDLLICDPPTFQKGSVDIKRDYPKILRRLNEFMAVESTLLLCLNAPDLGKRYLLDNMTELAPDFNLIDQIEAPKVFQDAEGKGLTVLCFKRV